MNGLLPLDILAAHLAGDFLLQSDWMAANKLRCWRARALHVATYAAAFLPVLALHWPGLGRALLFLGLLALSHFLTDSRRWSTGENWPAKPIVVDQVLHVIELAILARLFG